jgi:hypothetical protein
MKVALTDDGDAGERPAQCFGTAQAAKPCTEDNDMWPTLFALAGEEFMMSS